MSVWVSQYENLSKRKSGFNWEAIEGNTCCLRRGAVKDGLKLNSENYNTISLESSRCY